jgi:hypothetical protein
MRIAGHINFGIADNIPRLFGRRPLVRAVGFFVAAALLGACADELPTEVKKNPGEVRLNLSSNEGTRIGTDKQDYWLGETVTIDGWEWSPGETVRLQVVHVDEAGDNSRPEHQPWEVTADGDGHVYSSWAILVDGDEGGATLKLTADGLTSGTHAELIFTDLTGTVNLFADAGRTISQNAFEWNSTAYPSIRTPGPNTCYRATWTAPDAVVSKTYVQTPASAPTNANPGGMAVVQKSGTWSVAVDQRAASGACDITNDAGFGSATNPIYFDVARRVVIGAGTQGTTSDAATAGGDQCVYQTNNISSGGVPICQNPGGAVNITTFVRKQANDHIRTYLKFDIASLSPAIPAGVIVTDAKVRLVVAGTVTGRTYQIQRADASWAEGTVTWANQPGVTGTASTTPMASTLVAGTGGGDPQTWVKWDVDADVQGYVSASFANNGWRISDTTATNSSSAGRFNTTENTSGCAAGVTTCKRIWPVLLIDYSDPPKLVFDTPARTGEVGQCLGPIRLESQDFSGSPLAVGSDLTINLTNVNLGNGAGGTPGAGAFYSNSDCSSSTTTTTTITTGNTESANFYYRATARGDGGHDVVASATGYTPNPSQTQTIDKATTTLVYTGDRLILVGNTFNFSAVLSSAFEPCTEGKRIIFRIMPHPDTDTGDPFFQPGNPTTNTSGVATATASTTAWDEGIYDGRASFPGDDDCEASKDDYAVSILMPGGAATGGGFLAGSKVGGGRANFGFTVRQIEGSSPIAYKGQFLMIKQEGGVPEFRCKGNIDLYGQVVPNTTPASYAASGTCDFQLWDPALDGGNGDWYVPAGPGYAGQTFHIYFVDNGSGKGKNAPPPDQFGFTIGFVGPGDNPSFAMADINGGNIDVKSSGGTTTTSDGGSTGGKGKNR